MSREHTSEGCTSDITLKVTRSRLTSVHDELATLIVTSRCCQSGVAIKCCTCKIPFSKSEQLTFRQFYILLLHVSVHLILSGSLSVLTALYLHPNFNFTWRDMSKQIALRSLIFLAVMCSLVSILFSLFYLHSPVHPVSHQSSFIERKSDIRGTTDTPDMEVIKSADRADKWRGIRWWDLLKGGTRPSCGPEAKPRVFCVRSIGRLGNSLFSYASSLGVAMLVNASLLLWPEYVGLLPHLSLRGGIDNNLTVCQRALVRPERTCCIFQKTLVQAGRTCGRVQQLGGYLQSWRYFQHAQQEVRKDFQFRGIVLSSAQLIIGRIRRFNSFLYHEDHHRGDKRLAIENRKRNSVSRGMNVTPVTVVGIHVRHGDITINRQQIQMGYQTPPVEYYVRAMLYFRRRYGHVFYVITTDSRKYVMNYLLPACFRIGARCHLTKNNVFVDLAILASCDHVIMSVGTFGWWAAWLAGGEVVYYKYPAREGSVLRKYMNYSDFYPDRWIAME